MPLFAALLLQLSGHLPAMVRNKTYSLWDMYSSGFDLAATAVRAGETMLAANAVIGSRVGTMGAAARNPLTADYAELARSCRATSWTGSLLSNELGTTSNG